MFLTITPCAHCPSFSHPSLSSCVFWWARSVRLTASIHLPHFETLHSPSVDCVVLFSSFSLAFLLLSALWLTPIYLSMTLQSDSVYRKWPYHVLIISCVFLSQNMTHQDLSESHRCDFQLTTCSPKLQACDWLFSPVGSAVTLLRPLSSHHH